MSRLRLLTEFFNDGIREAKEILIESGLDVFVPEFEENFFKASTKMNFMILLAQINQPYTVKELVRISDMDNSNLRKYLYEMEDYYYITRNIKPEVCSNCGSIKLVLNKSHDYLCLACKKVTKPKPIVKDSPYTNTELVAFSRTVIGDMVLDKFAGNFMKSMMAKVVFEKVEEQNKIITNLKFQLVGRDDVIKKLEKHITEMRV